MSERSLDDVLRELRPALRSGIADLAERLMGPPSHAGKREHRWGSRGSFRVTVSGPKQGACADFESGWKGDPLAFIRNQRHTDFIGAVQYGCQFAGIAFDGEGKQEDPRIQAEREAERDRKRAEADAEQAADESVRTAGARRLWEASMAIDGTVAERYLTETRAIPRPAAGWPDAVRFHAGSRALIVAGTDSDGAVKFVQRVRLTREARKISGQAKNTDGVMAGAFVRLPGAEAGPLMLGEGPETGLSIWVAAGHETRLSAGSLPRHEPPPGRRVVICRDDDKNQSPSDTALKRAISGWMAAGADVSVATPWAVRRQDGTDFNDVLKTGGIEAVRSRIVAALEPTHTPVNRLTVAEGRTAVRGAVDAFYGAAAAYDKRRKQAEAKAKADLTAVAPFAAEVMAARQARAEHRASVAEARRLAAEGYPPSSEAAVAAKMAKKAARDRALIASEIAAEFKAETQKLQRAILAEAKAKGIIDAGPYPVHGVKVDVGVGKSEANLGNVVPVIRAMRAVKDKRAIVVAIPTLKLGDQQVQRIAHIPGAEDITAAVWRSRKAKLTDAQPMCLDLDAVADAEEALADVQTSVCRQKMADGSIRECKHFAECPFQAQSNLEPDVWFIAHELLFGQKPAVIGTPAIVVVDESAWQDGLFGTWLFLDTLISESATIPGEPLASAQLRSTRTALHTALSVAAHNNERSDAQ